MRRGRVAAVICALVCGLATSAGAAAAEEGDSAPIRGFSEGSMSWPEISSAASPEEYPIRLELGSGLAARQVNEHEVAIEYSEYGATSYTLYAPLAHDTEGAMVPTALRLTEGEVLTIIVRHRAGNPAKGSAPFAYPITSGEGWEGGYRTISFSLEEEPKPTPEAMAPVSSCAVPSLRGLSLRGAKSRLRLAHCSLGQVSLARGVTKAKGKVVKQFHAAGSQLAPGAPVAIKLGL